MSNNKINREIEEVHPIHSTYLVSGLLLLPQFYANNYRLELLIHYLLSHSRGKNTPNSKKIEKWLNDFNPISSNSILEDPVEDVFLGRVMTTWGDYRIYNGLWEGNDYYLQKILDTIQTIPPSIESDSLFRPVRALLSLSELVAKRNKAEHNKIVESNDKKPITVPKMEILKRLAKTLVFSQNDIKRIGFNMEDLKHFIFDRNLIKKLLNIDLGNTDLERFPVLIDGDNLILVLPNAISYSIRMYIFEWLKKNRLLDNFEANYASELLRCFRETPAIGKSIPQNLSLIPQKVSEAYFIDPIVKIDKGRYIHFLITIDTLYGFFEGGIHKPSPASNEQETQIHTRLTAAKNYLTTRDDFKEGLSLVVLAGYGRLRMIAISEKITDWNVEIISFQDLETMSWFPSFNDNTLWKVSEQIKRLREYNIDFHNINGLLNLYGWWVESDYQLIPDTVELGKGDTIISIPTDCMAKIRQNAREANDLHSERYIDGNLKRVRRKTLNPFFVECKDVPLYGSYQDIYEGQLLGCAITTTRPWWVKLNIDESITTSELKYKIWDALHNWMGRISLTLDSRFSGLISGPILFELDVSDLSDYKSFSELTASETGCMIEVQTDEKSNTIRLLIKKAFIYNLHNPINISEKEMVHACIKGFFSLSGEIVDDEKIKELLNRIVRNDAERYVHLFIAQTFRQIILSIDSCEFHQIDRFDASIIKIGLGHIDGVIGHREIIGKEECKAFLNKVVRHIWDDLKAKLKLYNRESLIISALRNIEGIAYKIYEWELSSRANLALNENPEKVYEAIRKEYHKYYAANLASRFIVETAICESPIDSGVEIESLDLSSLMSIASLITQMGSTSDEIDKGVTKARILITESGDIQTEKKFYEDIMNPFFARVEKSNLSSAADRYEKYYEEKLADRTRTEIFSKDFLEAFYKEIGVSVETLLRFREEMEYMAENKSKAVFTSKFSKIIEHCESGELCSSEDAINVINTLSLYHRNNWENPPSGYKSRDISPWLFRRRLSILMKPIVKLEEEDDPRYIISPGLIGVALGYIVDSYYSCNIEEDRCFSPEMKTWIGNERAKRGIEFNNIVADKLSNLGYEARAEVKVSSIIEQKTGDIDYGDIDVIAWKKDEEYIYIIECKDLFFAKNSKEVAEQLMEFKGKDRNGKPDRLKKHLKRIDVLSEHMDKLSKFCRIKLNSKEIVPYIVFSNPLPILYDKSDRDHDVQFACLEDILELGTLKKSSQ